MSQVLRCEQCGAVTDKPSEFRTVGHATAQLYGSYQHNQLSSESPYLLTADVCSVRCAIEWLEAQLTPGLRADRA